MAVPRPNPKEKKNLPAVAEANGTDTRTAMQKLDPIQKRLVLWVAKKKSHTEFARKNAKALVPKHDGSKQDLMKKARARVRAVMVTQDFRDALWEWSLMGVDLAMPDITAGIIGKASAGRVDAARLAMEITGRHAPNSEVQPAAIQIVLQNVPRPAVSEEIVDGDAEEIVDGELDEEAL